MSLHVSFLSFYFNSQLRYWQTRTHCCGHIVAHDVSHVAQTGKHLLRTQNVSDQNQKHFLCPQQMLRARANGETFVSATMCPQQCVLVCQYLKPVPGSLSVSEDDRKSERATSGISGERDPGEKRRGRPHLFPYQSPLVARPLFQSSALTESLEQATSQ